MTKWDKRHSDGGKRTKRTKLVRPPFWEDVLVLLHADFGVVRSGNNLTSWTDQKNGFVGVGVNSPQVNDTGFNDKRSIDITAANQGITFADDDGTWSLGTAWTLLRAYHLVQADTSIFETMFSVGTDVTERYQNRLGTSDYRAQFRTPGSKNVDLTGAELNTPDSEGIWVNTATGTTHNGWFDGTAMSTNPATLVEPWAWDNDVHLLNRQDYTGAAVGSSLRLWLLYNRVLSGVEKNAAAAWGEGETDLSTWSDI